MSQKDVFSQSEGNRYYERNKSHLVPTDEKTANDRILVSLKALAIRPRKILEIGCGNGWRLRALQTAYDAACFGIDPSAGAVLDGTASFPGVTLKTGTADNLPFEDSAFDLVIFGFCLYLCDRTDLFRIAFEADRVLQERGYLVILDFSPPFPYRNRYKHEAGVYAYKLPYASMFSWNPAYTLFSLSTFSDGDLPLTHNPDDRLSVAVLQKNAQGAYPDSPFASEK